MPRTAAAMTFTAAVLAVFPAARPLICADTSMDARIRAVTAEITPALVDVRRDIHAHPELGMREKRTAALVAERFRKLGLEVREGVGGTGVLGVLRGARPGRVVMMRGDMDALPITEEAPLSFASREKTVIEGRECGLMHACGHDVHTTVLMGVAEVLSRFRDRLAGTVLFVAQPGEEWGDGARAMIDDGVFKDAAPEAAFAFHVDESLNAGDVHYAPGYLAANVDGFTLVIKSEGGHGAYPSACVDPVVVGSRIVLDLQVMIARELSVQNDTVITVGSFHAGSASNVIPREGRLEATIRTYGDEQQALVKEKITRLVAGICASAGAQYTLDYYFGTPALYNDPKLMERIMPTMRRVQGENHLFKDAPGMGGEDFARFAKLAPAVMLGLGVRPKDIARMSVHSPTFIADEAAIPEGVTLMSAVIWDYLTNK
jgi:amidohydrolase